MTSTDKPSTQECNSCLLIKQTKVKCAGSLIKESRRVTDHADLCGPIRNKSHGCCVYFVPMTLGQQRSISLYLLKYLHNVERGYMDYINWIERHTRTRVGCLHTDNAAKFVVMRKHLYRLSITLITTSTHTAHSNGLMVGMKSTLLDEAR